MGKIHTLSSAIVEKIAAGEVIERPVFAVKELIENAIDANADYISIHLENAGLKKIVVEDNGEGMSKEDLLLSFQPHTTSKITHEAMLNNIQTLGFRGEALASIAVISNMHIESKTKEKPAGTSVDLIGMSVESISPIGMPIGTSVTVEHIFAHTPVRKKFMKAPSTEFRLIIDMLSKIAISFPHIGFTLTHNKKPFLQLPKNQNRFERISLLLGDIVTESLVPFIFEDSYIKLSGYLAKPHIQTKDTRKQFIAINKRSIIDKGIALAVKEAYGNLLEPLSAPIFLLFLQVPNEIVDINVHPQKEQIQFVDNRIIFTAVYTAVKQTLFDNNLTFENVSWKQSGKGLTASFSGKLLKEKVAQETKIVLSADILQLRSTYLITESRKGIMLIDQHAASERIFYEKFIQLFNEEKKKRKEFLLKIPLSFTLSLSDAEMLQESIPLFSALGFTIEHVRDTRFKLVKVPLLFKDRNCLEIILETLDTVAQEKNTQEIDSKTIKMLQFLACRTAIKAGDTLSKKQAKELLKKLEQTENSFICAHGRPTKIEISELELEKMFRRT